MVKNRISVSFNEKNFFWIIVEEGRIINRNPAKEDLMGTKLKSYNKTNICDICREEKEKHGIELTDNSILCPNNALRELYDKKNWTGRWLCYKCWYKIDYKNRPDRKNTWHDILKPIGGSRTGNLNPECSTAKGNKFQKLTCKWRNIKDLNIENDDYNTPIDHSRDAELGIIQTRGRFYNKIAWYFSHLDDDWGKQFDNMICYCASKDRKLIERIYIFPLKEIKKRTNIGIYKSPKDKWGNPITSWYEQYRIIDEETINKVNDIWRTI